MERLMRRFAALLVVVVVVVLFVPSSSATAGATGEESEDGGVDDVELTLAAETGWERFRRDDYLSSGLHARLTADVPELPCLEEGTGNCRTRFRFGLQVPLRVRIADRGARDGLGVRTGPWFDWRRALRVLRYLRYGDEDAPFRLRLGELGRVELGRGTIVGDFFNTLRPTSYRPGVTSRLTLDGGGGKVVVDDVVTPSLIAGRIFLNPWKLAEHESWARRLRFGVTVAGDPGAPVAVRNEELAGRSRVSGEGRAIVERRPAVVGGIDVSLNPVDRGRFEFEPYAAMNVHVGLGHGYHLGAESSVSLEGGMEFSAQLEARMLHDRYVPRYFGPRYLRSRSDYLGWGRSMPAPKLRAAGEREPSTRLGGFGELRWRWPGTVSMSLAYADHEGAEDGEFKFGIRTSPADWVRAGAYVYRYGFEDLSAVAKPGRTMVSAESRVRIVGPLYMKGGYGLDWGFDSSGNYSPDHYWNLGVGVSYRL